MKIKGASLRGTPGLWALLMALALLGAGSGLKGWTTVAWLLALVKGCVVSERLMELRGAPWRWRALVPLWLILCVGGVLLLSN